MFPVETLKHLQQMSEAASPARRIATTDREPAHVYYVQDAAGELHRTIAVGAPHRHRAADLDTLVRVAAAGANPQIWYARTEVVAVADVANPHSPTCRLALAPSPQLARLAEWERAGKANPTQQELVILLRTLFAGCAPADLLPTIRGVRTNKKAEVDSQIAQGKVSLGKALVAEMTGTSAIPERVAFSVPVFAQAAVFVSASVRVEIDPDPQNERFNLYVMPGDIESAFAHAEDAIAGRLRKLLADEGPREIPIPVYRGTP